MGIQIAHEFDWIGRTHFSSLMTCILFTLLLSTPALADHNRFDPRVDYSHVDWFDRGLYKASLPYQDCIDLSEFYTYADSNPYDNLNREDIKSYKYQLGFDDLARLSQENPSDSITINDLSTVEDLHCSTLPEYQSWRQSRPSFRDEDYYHLFGYSHSLDFDHPENQVPINDYSYAVGPYGVSHYEGGYASWVPFSWFSRSAYTY